LACVAADRFGAAWEQQHRGASGRRCCTALFFSLSRGCVQGPLGGVAPHFLGRERVFRPELSPGSRPFSIAVCLMCWAHLRRSRGGPRGAVARNWPHRQPQPSPVSRTPHLRCLFVKSATAHVGPLTLHRGRQPPHGSMSRALASSFLQASRAGPTRSMSSSGGLARACEAARTCVPASRRGAQPSRRARRAPCSRCAAVLFEDIFQLCPLTCWQRLLQSVLSHAPFGIRVDAQCRSLVVMLCKMEVLFIMPASWCSVHQA